MEKSKYFVALLGPNFREGRSDGDIILPHIDGKTLRFLIAYCYFGEVQLNYDNIDDIVPAASSMEFVELEIKCRDFLEEKLATENCIQSFLLADQFSFDLLKVNAYERILNDFGNVPPREFVRLDFKIFVELLKSDEIEASEEIIFERLKLWMDNNWADLKERGPEMLRLLRLNNLSTEVTEISVSIMVPILLCFFVLSF